MIKDKEPDVKLEADLISKGFKRKWLGDKSGSWLEYPFKGPFKTACKIIVDISFRQLSIEMKNTSLNLGIADSRYIDINYNYSPERIKRVLKEVKKVNNAKWMTK